MNLRDTIATNEKIIDLILKKSEVNNILDLHGPDFAYTNLLSKENAHALKYLAAASPSQAQPGENENLNH